MKGFLLMMLSVPLVAQAQIFTPQDPGLPGGVVGQQYSTFVLATIPDSTVVSGFDVAAMLIQQFPPLALFINDIQGLSYPMAITNVECTPTGLPEGLSNTCTPSLCRFPSGFNGSMVFSGTPAVTGLFTVSIATYTRGVLDISELTTGLGIPGLPTEFQLPEGLHTLFDADYTILIESAPIGVGGTVGAQAPTIAPDRSSGRVSVTLHGNLGQADRLSVIDMSGRTVAEAMAQGGLVLLEMKNASPGIHVLLLEAGGAVTATRFIY